MTPEETALRNRFYDVARDFLDTHAPDLSTEEPPDGWANLDASGEGGSQAHRAHVTLVELFERATQHGLSIGDAAFYVHCVLTAMKYEDRAGRKGDAREDNEKAMWYRRMANHLLGFGPDPRAARPGFQPYTRPA
jgi:hypothetical protein